MKKRVSPVLLGAKGSRRGLMKTQLFSLFKHGKITTAHNKAKQLARLTDRLIARTDGKEIVEAKRYLLSLVSDRGLVKTIWDYSQSVRAKRKSGYTTLTKLGARRGDAHEQSILELVDFVKQVKKPAKTKELTEKKAKPAVKKTTKKNA